MTCIKEGEIENEEKRGKGSKFSTLFYFSSSERGEDFNPEENKIKKKLHF